MIGARRMVALAGLALAVTGASGTGPATPEGLGFGKVYAYPNPALRGRKATFHIELKGRPERVSLRVYDVTGNKISEQAAAGPAAAHEQVWEDGGAASGIYIFVVEAVIGGQMARTRGLVALVR